MASSPRNKRKPPQGAGASSGTYSDVYKRSATSAAVPVAASSAAVAMASSPAREANLRSTDNVDWSHDYHYVLADLRYLGIITAIITGTIIVVGIFI